MAYTFSLAQGGQVGDSLVEPDKVDLAKELLAAGGDKLVLPVDTHCGDAFSADCKKQVVAGGRDSRRLAGARHRPEDGRALRQDRRKARRRSSGTGRWACSRCRRSTREPRPWPRPSPRATTSASSAAATAPRRSSSSASADKVTHVSTGGGASLAMLEGQKFAAVELLDDKS